MTRGRLMRFGSLVYVVVCFMFVLSARQHKACLDGTSHTQNTQLVRKGQVWRLLTSTFLAKRIIELVINSYALRGVGSYIERDCGDDHLRDAYIVSAVASSTLECLYGTGLLSGDTGALLGISTSWWVYHTIRGNKTEIDAAAWQTVIFLLLSLAGSSFASILGGMAGGAVVALSWKDKPIRGKVQNATFGKRSLFRRRHRRSAF